MSHNIGEVKKALERGLVEAAFRGAVLQLAKAMMLERYGIELDCNSPAPVLIVPGVQGMETFYEDDSMGVRLRSADGRVLLEVHGRRGERCDDHKTA